MIASLRRDQGSVVNERQLESTGNWPPVNKKGDCYRLATYDPGCAVCMSYFCHIVCHQLFAMKVAFDILNIIHVLYDLESQTYTLAKVLHLVPRCRFSTHSVGICSGKDNVQPAIFINIDETNA